MVPSAGFLAATGVAGTLLFAASNPGTLWSGFRNGGSGPVNARRLPIHWSPTDGVAWKVRLAGYGQSAPAVMGDRLYVTSVPGRVREKCMVQALEAKTGRTVWQTEIPASSSGELHDMVSRAAPTPMVDAAGAYVLFESGDVARLSPKDGRVVWTRALFREFGAYQNNHGYGSSPAQSRNAVFILVDHQGPSYLLALDKSSGRTLWKTSRPSRMSWSSPVVATHEGREVVIVSSSGDVRAYDAQSGEELWVFEGINGNHIPSAVVDGDRIFVGASVPRGPRAGSGRTTAQSNCALRMDVRDGKAVASLLWEGRGGVCEYGSPAVHRGLVYTVNPAGVAYAADAGTGEVRYSERVDGPSWVPPIGHGDLVYFCSKAGVTTVVKSGPTFERVATNRLWEPGAAPSEEVNYAPPARPQGVGGRPGGGEAGARGGGGEARAAYGPLDPCVYGVAAVDGAFYVRVGSHLFCVREGRKPAASGR